MNFEKGASTTRALCILGAIVAVTNAVEQQCNDVQHKIARSLSDIVDKVIEKAKADGSVPHAKFLVDWAELKPGTSKPAPAKAPATRAVQESKFESAIADPEEPDVAEVLLNTLREMLEEAKAAKKAEEANQAAAGISVP